MEGTLQQINLSDIGDTVGTPPSSNLVGSIRKNGVVQPIVLAESPDENGEIRLLLIDGNRRVRAARSNGITSIPAIVLTGIEPEAISRLTLILNGFRAGNYLSEFWAIRQLEKQQLGESDILSLSGLSKSMLKKRTALSDLDRDLFVALRNGKIYQTHAAAIALLPIELQGELASLYRRQGRLQQSDVNRYKPVKSAKSEAPTISDSLERLAWSAQTSYPAPKRSPTTAGQLDAVAHHPSLPNHVDDTSPGFTPPQIPTETGRDAYPEELPSVIAQNPPYPGSHDAAVGIRSNLIPSENAAQSPPNESREIQVLTTASRAASSMRNAVIAAQILDFTKEEFLEMAARVWDETVSQKADQQLMRDQAPNDPFPDLAAHKWDTGES